MSQTADIRTELSRRLKGKVLLIGTGNTLRGDDGIGPALIGLLEGKVKASLLDADDVRVIFLILDERSKYHRFASAEERGITRTAALRKLLKPMTTVAAATALIGGMIQESDQ